MKNNTENVRYDPYMFSVDKARLTVFLEQGILKSQERHQWLVYIFKLLDKTAADDNVFPV